MSENIEKKEIHIDKRELKKQTLLIGKAMLFSFLILFIIALFGKTDINYSFSDYPPYQRYYEVSYDGVLGNTDLGREMIPNNDNGNSNFLKKIYIAYIPLILKVNFMTFFILSFALYIIIKKTKNYTIKIK